MSSSPTISICLPIFNGEQFLVQAIESALNQTFTDFELLICDDASSDNSFEIARAYSAKDNRVFIWRNDCNRGLFENYNHIMSKATGKYIKPFAQDDVWDQTLLARLKSPLEQEHNLSLVACNRQYVTDAGVPILTPRQLADTATITGAKQQLDCLLQTSNWIGEPSVVMFPRRFACNGFDERFYHLADLELWLRILANGDYHYVHDCLCNVHKHDASATNRNLKGLLFAIDLLLLGEKHAEVLHGAGMAVHDYKLMAASNISRFLWHLFINNEVDLPELLSITPRDARLRDILLAQFKELAFYALLSGAENEKKSKQLIDSLHDRLEQSEHDLNNVLNSRTWRMTKLIRSARSIARSFKMEKTTRYLHL